MTDAGLQPRERIRFEGPRRAMTRFRTRLIHGLGGRATWEPPPPAPPGRYHSYSGEGEDMLLRPIFKDQESGTYVDVGAYHPTRYSNTAHYYERGWRGINIDADADAIAVFEQERPDDTNIAVGVGTQAGVAEFQKYDEGAFNTFEPAIAEKREGEGTVFSHTHVERVQIRPLADILREHLGDSAEIDFFDIDVEGRDLDVLRSNDWESFRPHIVLAECLLVPYEEVPADPTIAYLTELGYVPVAKTPNTVALRDSDWSGP